MRRGKNLLGRHFDLGSDACPVLHDGGRRVDYCPVHVEELRVVRGLMLVAQARPAVKPEESMENRRHHESLTNAENLCVSAGAEKLYPF